MKLFVVYHDPEMTVNSRSYAISYHKTREGADKFVEDHKLNDWEFWNILEVLVKD